MVRIILLYFVFAFTNEAFSQHILTTRIENTALVQWAENRLKIVVEGHICSEIVVTTSNGQIRMNHEDCEMIYTASDTSIRSTTIKIGIKQRNGVKWLKELDLPVLSLPDPTPVVGGYPSGSLIPREIFLAQPGITVPVTDGWHLVQIENKQRITHYSVKISRKDSVIFSRTGIEGFLFLLEMLQFIKSFILQDDEITFFDIETLIYEKERRHLKGAYKLTVK